MNETKAFVSEVVHCDIAIVGGGMAGSALACALADTGWQLAVIESMPGAVFDPAAFFDARVVALNESSRALLDRLGVWEDISSTRISSYRYMQVWDGEGTASVSFDAADIQRPALGYIVENSLVVAALQQRARREPAVRWLCPDKVIGLADEAGRTLLSLASGTVVEASLVVAADGATSSLRRLAGIDTMEWDYGHTAVVATVQCERPHGRTARQVFLPDGPLAFLPLCGEGGDEHWCSIVWSVAPDLAETLLALPEAEFSLRLARAFEYRLGEIQAVRGRFAFPLRQRHARVYHKGNVVLVGDAAHTIHPLAGQGVNLGFMDVTALADELHGARAKGLAPSHLDVLARYQRRRHGDNLEMTATMELFKRLFERRELPLRWLRNAGMRSVDGLPALKRRIMKHAMGL